MHKLVLAVSLVGCWSDSQPARPTPAPVAAAKPVAKPVAYGGAAYGGAAYGGVQNGAFASLTGTGDISSGFDDTNIYGGLLGNEVGDGSGSGGGGTGWGTIGTGRYGTIGHGSGGGVGGMRGAHAAVPTVSLGQPASAAGLDKAIIRRYIKRNLQKIQYCYEKELLSRPGLAGKVTVTFRIEPTGKVGSSTGSGLAVVDACVADVIVAIEFPKPQGGGTVDVTYPFEFRAATP